MRLGWMKIEAGNYWSTCGRFHILKHWDRLHGNCWYLRDKSTEKEYYENTMTDCIFRAEQLVKE